MATAQLDALLRHIRMLAGRGCSLQGSDRQLLEDFAASRNEAAFSTLVARHGPMVLHVCRRVLNHEQDAEDSFQATFLVLAQNTGSIRKPEALAEWLHGVAYRTAMEAKRKAARRRKHETRLRTLLRKTAASPTWDDTQAVLDEEIQRLPTAFRAAFVLTVLEGKSAPQAAVALGIQPGTVWSRLARARLLLQQRLSRRGIELSALLAALTLAESSGRAGLPALLVSATVRSGLLVAAGGTAPGVVPAHVATLAAGVTRAMFLTKIKFATAILLTVGLLAGGTGVFTHQVLAGKPVAPQQTATTPSAKSVKLAAMPEAAKPEPTVTEEKTQDHVRFSGRVLGPDGQPVAGAKLYVTSGNVLGAAQSPLYATTGADGRFEFTAPIPMWPIGQAFIAATAANHGAGLVKPRWTGTRDNLTVRLVDDDVPITGQIVDLEGKPVPGATVTVLKIAAAPGDDLGPWLEALKLNSKGAFKGMEAYSGNLENKYLSPYTVGMYKVATDTEGRFRITGIGRNRLVQARLDGPGIVSQELHILTRPGNSIEATKIPGRPEYGQPRHITTYYPASFRHVAAPSKPIVGLVRDKETKKPLSGIMIQSVAAVSPEEIVEATTDSQGRYRLMGMPKGEGNMIQALPPGDLPYAGVTAKVPDSPGLDPVTVDMEMERGVWIEGKITDKVTGKTARAGVEYFAVENGNTKPPPIFHRSNLHDLAKADGSYRIVGFPGPGVLVVWPLQSNYLRASQRDDEFGSKGLSDADYPSYLRRSTCAALVRLNIAKGTSSVKQDVTLDPGWKLSGTVLGPDGKPLAGAMSFLLVGHWWDSEATKTAEFTAWFNPHELQEILFQHREKGLVARVQPPKENGASVTVHMEPGAAVTGRLVDAQGKPRAGVELDVKFQPKGWRIWLECFPDPVRTDREGRFRIEALLPDSKLRLSDGGGELPFGDALRGGQMHDLGDVQLKPRD